MRGVLAIPLDAALHLALLEQMPTLGRAVTSICASACGARPLPSWAIRWMRTRGRP
jgi:hypothetical protein